MTAWEKNILDKELTLIGNRLDQIIFVSEERPLLSLFNPLFFTVAPGKYEARISWSKRAGELSTAMCVGSWVLEGPQEQGERWVLPQKEIALFIGESFFMSGLVQVVIKQPLLFKAHFASCVWTC